MNVCIGGTFDRLHKGHKTLIKKAFEISKKNSTVFIGITTDSMIKNKKNNKSLDERIKNLEEYLNKENYPKKYIIKPISDKFGPSINGDFEAIVVSPETKNTAEQINIKRQQIGKKPLKIFTIPLVLSNDNIPISSTRIKNKKINENGQVLKRD